MCPTSGARLRAAAAGRNLPSARPSGLQVSAGKPSSLRPVCAATAFQRAHAKKMPRIETLKQGVATALTRPVWTALAQLTFPLSCSQGLKSGRRAVQQSVLGPCPPPLVLLGGGLASGECDTAAQLVDSSCMRMPKQSELVLSPSSHGRGRTRCVQTAVLSRPLDRNRQRR